MKEKCFIDKNIILSKSNLMVLRSLNLEICNYEEDRIEEAKFFLLHSKILDSKLNKMKECKYIGIRAFNIDYINENILIQKGIFIEGLKNQYGVNSVAEHTLSLILALSKNIVNAHKNVIEDKWRTNLNMNYELNNKKLGIIGYGKIGQKVAELGKAFGMEILIAAKKDNIKFGEIELEKVLIDADIISLHLSSKEENNKYIGKKELKLMKQNSILINTSRGMILDYVALDKELQHGKFLGVGLDVFETEPLNNSNLKNYSNVILSPHIAYLTEETLNNMNNELIENLKNYIIKNEIK